MGCPSVRSYPHCGNLPQRVCHAPGLTAAVDAAAAPMPQSAAAAAAAIAAVDVAAVDTPPPKPDHLQGMLADKAAQPAAQAAVRVRVDRNVDELMDVDTGIGEAIELNALMQALDGKGLAPCLSKRPQPAPRHLVVTCLRRHYCYG